MTYITLKAPLNPNQPSTCDTQSLHKYYTSV